MSIAAPDITLATRLVGGVWGHLVGDAMGVPYEFRSADHIGEIRWGETGSHRQRPGTWSDDGALMLALLDSLTADGVGFDVEDQGRRALAWRWNGAYTPDHDGAFDIGNATRAALRAIESGTPAADAGPSTIDANGNGSLMRILPVALAGRDLADDHLIDQARRASRVTHGHPRAQAACALYTLTAARLLTGERDRAAAHDDAIAALRGAISEEPEMVGALDHLLGWQERSGRGVVWDSFWSAWDAFAGASTYQETIERAIAYGKDTDTTAAIAGGLAGIYWGVDGIPPDWLDGMRGQDIVAPLVDALLATAGWKTSTARPLRVDWIPADAVPAFGGRLGMTFLVGKQRDGWSGRHWRDLKTDAKRLAGEHQANAYVLLVEDHELEAARVGRIEDALEAEGVHLVRFPIRDVDVTDDVARLRAVLRDIRSRLDAGERVVVACRGGLGRTGTVVACLLCGAGLDPDAAIAATRSARPGAIETPAQERFVRAWGGPLA
jgi:ADP-ribosyl-[dinitrogen reductase] hydrolase